MDKSQFCKSDIITFNLDLRICYAGGSRLNEILMNFNFFNSLPMTLLNFLLRGFATKV